MATGYSDKERKDITETICNEISNGRSLRYVLDKVPHMPNRTTFLRWVENDESIRNQYTRACEARAERIFEDVLIIADSQDEDIIQLEDGREVVNHDAINRARLRIDSRKWMLGKMQPKKYGEKLDLSSSDGTMTPKTNIITTLTPDELKKAIDK